MSYTGWDKAALAIIKIIEERYCVCDCDEAYTSRQIHEPNAAHFKFDNLVFEIKEEILGNEPPPF